MSWPWSSGATCWLFTSGSISFPYVEQSLSGWVDNHLWLVPGLSFNCPWLEPSFSCAISRLYMPIFRWALGIVYPVSLLSFIITGMSKIRSQLFVCTESRLQRSRTDCEKCPELSIKLIVAESMSSYIGSRFTICRSRLSTGKCLSWESCTILWLSVASVLFLNLSDFDYLWLYPDYSCLDADCIWVFWLSFTITRLAIPGHHCLLVLTPESVGNDWLWDDPECLELSWLSMIGYMSSYHWPRFSCIEPANPELVILACWDLDYLKLFLLWPWLEFCFPHVTGMNLPVPTDTEGMPQDWIVIT